MAAVVNNGGIVCRRSRMTTKMMILQKELTPGQFINEAQFQALLGLGRTPVREAVFALARDNLVHIHPRKGIEISRPTLKDIHDIFEIRFPAGTSDSP